MTLAPAWLLALTMWVAPAPLAPVSLPPTGALPLAAIAPSAPHVTALDSSLGPVASPPPVFELWDAGNKAELAKLDPKTLRSALEKGRVFESIESGDKKVTLEDGFGRSTDLYLRIPKKPKGVIFVLHGLGGAGTQLIGGWEKWALANDLIVAAPSAKRCPKKHSNEDWSPTSDSLPHWWSYHPDGFILKALAQLKKQYPIEEDRVFLTGYSMGGFGTWNLGLRFADRFAALLPMAGGISQREYMLENDAEVRKILFNAANVPIYFYHGDSDNTVNVRFDRKSRDQLKEFGYDFEYVEARGVGHMTPLRDGGKKVVGAAQKWLGKKTRKSHPKTVCLHSFGDYMAQSYWIRIDERHEDGPARVTAQVGKRNKIAIVTENVKKLTVFFDEELVNLKKAVQVTVDGKRAFRKKIKPSSEVLLESWEAREDRQLLYSAKAEIDVKKKKAKRR